MPKNELILFILEFSAVLPLVSQALLPLSITLEDVISNSRATFRDGDF